MASSLQEYLKRYTSDADTTAKSKKKKKKRPSKPVSSSIRLVDADPVWQKELKEESSESEEEQGRSTFILLHLIGSSLNFVSLLSYFIFFFYLQISSIFPSYPFFYLFSFILATLLPFFFFTFHVFSLVSALHFICFSLIMKPNWFHCSKQVQGDAHVIGFHTTQQ